MRPISLHHLLFAGLLVVFSSALSLKAEERNWTNTEGKVIYAEFISMNETHVKLRFKGKEIDYALDKLSAEDREFLSQHSQLQSNNLNQEAKTGWLDHIEISQAAFTNNEDYLKSPNAKAVYNAFKNKEFPSSWTENNEEIEEMFFYEDGAMIVYVPPSYNPAKPMGVYLHVSPSDQGQSLKSYIPIMDRYSMIYVSPKGTSNAQPMMRRVKISVDAVAAVQKIWNVDQKRIVAGGLSGGGHIAMLIHAMFPQIFSASISHAAQSYLPHDGGCGHFPGLSQRDLSGKDFKEHKWVVISGNKDFNYQEILKTSEEWLKLRYAYRFIDVENMAHTNASPENFSEALEWVLNSK